MLPSSPPARDLSSSPPLPARPPRKRPHADSGHVAARSSSGDLPVFSSDDIQDASVDDYARPRRKRFHHGPWWHHGDAARACAEPPAPKGDLARNVDSGVWMGSDGSDDSLALPPVPVACGPAVPALTDAPPASQTKQAPSRPDPAADRVRREVSHCLETGREIVDLSDQSLVHLEGDALAPLKTLVRQSPAFNVASDTECYESLTPRLQLYLFRNELVSLPFELWSLQNLTVLSLRNNRLTELPPAISNLVNLVELNLSGNLLRWLPYELLRLFGSGGRLRRFTASPNPFVQPFDLDMQNSVTPRMLFGAGNTDQQRLDTLYAEEAPWLVGTPSTAQPQTESTPADQESPNEFLRWVRGLEKTLYLRMKADGHSGKHSPTTRENLRCRCGRGGALCFKVDPVYMASTPPALLKSDGSPIQGSATPPSRVQERVIPAGNPDIEFAHAGHLESRVPSLFELCLRTCASASLSTQLQELLPPGCPSQIVSGLDEATKAREGRLCSVCRSKYVIARAEWIQYWHHDPDSLTWTPGSLFLPFLRRACSPKCAAEALSTKHGEGSPV
ncbi:hypothetical protein BDY21DRAFT_42128 [Lineolata rhizophorae]|uniref:Leucine rich repeat domain protein n=1 Tax=Lineolata rhizophorae TaxID=578093 RepID=A0A6A6NYD5_9PEZI|nr:hypothetical protein BDY21DRAFT_42128 [Lineolata rhizophorae]